MPLNLVNSGTETAENRWRVFAHPLNFRIGTHCQSYITDSMYTLARVMVCERTLTLGFAIHLVKFKTLK